MKTGLSHQLPLASRRRPSASTDRPGRPGAVSGGSPPRRLLALLLLCLTAQADAGYCVPGVPQPPIPQDLTLAARIQPAPPAITALARQRNLGNGVAIEPRPASLDHPVAQALARMLAEVPDGLRRLAQGQVGAIHLVQGNFGSARVEAMRDAQGRVFGGCILLNLDALARSANAWASWREESAFRAEDGYRIALTLEPAQTDSVEAALRFVFLHELG
ncbi:MAG TPA: hypothetical protein VES73_06855, partial [Lamprocystis sp. (in: g-proteobacteria)]|nr:hypothetical protein [Lamprocystis sp. (in: g-proteobacteria)]